MARAYAAPPDRRPIVISGPSGVGKGTLCERLLQAYPETFATTVSHTTRKPRPGEVEGSSYYFISRAEFESLVASGAFIEHAEFNGNLYGTSKQTVADQTARGAVVVLDIELEGVRQLKAELPEQQAKENLEKKPLLSPRFIFIKPPTLEVLGARLRGRATEDEESTRRRLARARAELEYAEGAGAHDKVIVNDDLERAFRELEDFVFAAPGDRR